MSGAAIVSKVSGAAFVIRGGKEIAITQGMELLVSDSVRTGMNGQCELSFADQTEVQLSPMSQVQIQDFAFNPEVPAENSFAMHMMEGLVRTVSGEVVKLNPEGFALSTPLGTAGIRGTTVLSQIFPTHVVFMVTEMGSGNSVVVDSVFGGQLTILLPGQGAELSLSDQQRISLIDSMPDNMREAVEEFFEDKYDDLRSSHDSILLFGDAEFLAALGAESVSRGVGMLSAESEEIIIGLLQELGVEQPEFFLEALFGPDEAQSPKFALYEGSPDPDTLIPSAAKYASGFKGVDYEIRGYGGNDKIVSFAGQDLIYGGLGEDSIQKISSEITDGNLIVGGESALSGVLDKDGIILRSLGASSDNEAGYTSTNSAEYGATLMSGGSVVGSALSLANSSGGGNQISLYGDMTGGDIYGSAQSVTGSSLTGNNISISQALGGGGLLDGGAIYGDAYSMNSSTAGNDVISVVDMQNGAIYGDAATGSYSAGNNEITVTGVMSGGDIYAGNGADTVEIGSYQGGNINMGLSGAGTQELDITDQDADLLLEGVTGSTKITISNVNNNSSLGVDTLAGSLEVISDHSAVTVNTVYDAGSTVYRELDYGPNTVMTVTNWKSGNAILDEGNQQLEIVSAYRGMLSLGATDKVSIQDLHGYFEVGNSNVSQNVKVGTIFAGGNLATRNGDDIINVDTLSNGILSAGAGNDIVNIASFEGGNIFIGATGTKQLNITDQKANLLVRGTTGSIEIDIANVATPSLALGFDTLSGGLKLTAPHTAVSITCFYTGSTPDTVFDLDYDSGTLLTMTAWVDGQAALTDDNQRLSIATATSGHLHLGATDEVSIGTVEENFEVSNGTVAQKVTVGSLYKNASTLITGDGDDVITMTGPMLQGTINSKGGADIITIAQSEGTSMNGASRVILGDPGNGKQNEVTLSGGMTYMAAISGSTGKDVIGVGAMSSSAGIAGGGGADEISAASMAGNSSITLGDPNGGNNKVTVYGDMTSKASITGSTGKDVIKVGDMTDTTSIAGGGGADEITADSMARKASITGGTGTDVISVGSMKDTTSINGGGGADEISADSMTHYSAIILGDPDGGNNKVTVKGDMANSTSISGSTGVDVIEVLAMSAHAKISANGGADEIKALSMAGYSSISLGDPGAGNNKVTVTVTMDDSAGIHGSTGVDLIEVGAMSGDASISANGGADEIKATSMAGDSKILLGNPGDGNSNLVTVSGSMSGAAGISGSEGKDIINGGAMSGTASINSGIGGDEITAAGMADNSKIILGNPGDGKSNQVTVSGAMTDTAGISGSAGVDLIEVNAMSGDASISANGGADEIEAVSMADNSKIILGDPGIGKNVVTVSGSMTDKASISGSTGVDIINGGDMSGEASIDSGKGGDEITAASMAGESKIILTYAGNDTLKNTVTVSGVMTDTASITGSSGADSISVGSLSGNAGISGVSGFDTITVAKDDVGLSMSGNSKIALGLYNSTLTLSGAMADEASITGTTAKQIISVGAMSGKASIDSGKGHDEITVASMAGNSLITMTYSDNPFIENQLTVSGAMSGDASIIGTGGDSITVGSMADRSQITLGDQNTNTLTVTGSMSGDASIISGSKNATIEIGTYESGSIDLGSGGDTLIINTQNADLNFSGLDALFLHAGAGTSNNITFATTIAPTSSSRLTLDSNTHGKTVTVTDLYSDGMGLVAVLGGSNTLSLGKVTRSLTVYGDANNSISASAGDNDSIFIEELIYVEIFGDAMYMVNSDGGNDTIEIRSRPGRAGTVDRICGDAFRMTENCSGGHDSIIIGPTDLSLINDDSIDIVCITIYGDANEMTDSSGGNDTITLTGICNDGWISGDSFTKMTNSSGGNDSITADTLTGGVVCGDGYWAMVDSSGGDDIITITKLDDTTMYADGREMTNSSGGDDKITITECAGTVYGDGQTMTNCMGGNDIIKIGNLITSETLCGDGFTVTGTGDGSNSICGNDRIEIGLLNAYGAAIYGDAYQISKSTCGNDTIIITTFVEGYVFGDRRYNDTGTNVISGNNSISIEVMQGTEKKSVYAGDGADTVVISGLDSDAANMHVYLSMKDGGGDEKQDHLDLSGMDSSNVKSSATINVYSFDLGGNPENVVYDQIHYNDQKWTVAPGAAANEYTMTNNDDNSLVLTLNIAGSDITPWESLFSTAPVPEPLPLP